MKEDIPHKRKNQTPPPPAVYNKEAVRKYLYQTGYLSLSGPARYPFYSPRRVKEFLQTFQLGTPKSLGQNFLTNGNIINNMADYITSNHPLKVLEIGGGPGALTLALFKKQSQTNGQLSVVEVDRFFGQLLQTLYEHTVVQVIQADVLTLSNDSLQADVIAGNLPYAITTPIIEKVLDSGVRSAFFLVQKEFADRLLEAGGQGWQATFSSRLSLTARSQGSWKARLQVKGDEFYPPPKVLSTFVEYSYGDTVYRLEPNERAVLTELGQIFFWGRRKTAAKCAKDSPFWTGRTTGLRKILLNRARASASASEANEALAQLDDGFSPTLLPEMNRLTGGQPPFNSATAPFPNTILTKRAEQFTFADWIFLTKVALQSS